MNFIKFRFKQITLIFFLYLSSYPSEGHGSLMFAMVLGFALAARPVLTPAMYNAEVKWTLAGSNTSSSASALSTSFYGRCQKGQEEQSWHILLGLWRPDGAHTLALLFVPYALGWCNNDEGSLNFGKYFYGGSIEFSNSNAIHSNIMWSCDEIATP